MDCFNGVFFAPYIIVHCMFIVFFSQFQFSASLPMFANKYYPTFVRDRAKSISCAQHDQLTLKVALSFKMILFTSTTKKRIIFKRNI